MMIHSKFKALFLHNFAFDDPEVFSSKPKIEVKVKVKSVKELFVLSFRGSERHFYLVTPSWLG